MNAGATYLYDKLLKKNYYPKKICEVGVYLPEESNVFRYIHENIETTLIEPDPDTILKINQCFSGMNNVTVVEAAVFDFNGQIELCKQESSTFISSLESSPALINDGCIVKETEKFMARSILFSEVDRGDFDLISIDIEGADWYVIKHMISRPNIISIETHSKYYTNPGLKNISDWMEKNEYIKWYKFRSDTVFIKKGVFPVSLKEWFLLKFKTIEIALISKKKIFKPSFYLKKAKLKPVA